VTKRLVADVLLAAARAQHAAEPTFGMLYLAVEAAELGEPDTALEIVKQATAKDDGSWFALLATVHARIGRDIDQLATKALKDPSSWVHGTLASAYERIGEPGRADKQIALVKKAQRFGTIAAVARIALAAGNLERAAKLAEQPWARKSAPSKLAALEIDLARAYATVGDTKTARRLLEDAEKLDREGSIVERAQAWAALGETTVARDVAARADTGRYREIENLTAATAYAAAGDTAKVDTILAAYAASAADRKTAAGYAEAALTYLRFGRELGVTKHLKAAEAALAATTDPVLLDAGHNSLAIAYVLDKQFVKAIDHIAALGDPELRAERLRELARALRDAKVEATPELEAALRALQPA
jgi:hypothetical protein